MDKIVSNKDSKIIVDASTLMVGIQMQHDDPRYSFDSMKVAYMDSFFTYYNNIKIHEEVYRELDDVRRAYVSNFEGFNVEIVGENGLYGVDPIYTTIFNKIANHDLFHYTRDESFNRGDVYSLAYAAYHKIPVITTRDGSITTVVNEITELNGTDVLGFEYVLALSYLLNESNKDLFKRLKSLYKSQCTPAINRKLIPQTFSSFLEVLANPN